MVKSVKLGSDNTVLRKKRKKKIEVSLGLMDCIYLQALFLTNMKKAPLKCRDFAQNYDRLIVSHLK